MTATLSNIRVGVYLVNIPDHALDWLRAFVTRTIITRAPRFAAWLLDLVDDEALRRCRTMIGTPREPAMPTLDPLAWTNVEVAEALNAAVIAAAIVSNPEAKKFLERVRTVIVAIAAHRLRHAETRAKGGHT